LPTYSAIFWPENAKSIFANWKEKITSYQKSPGAFMWATPLINLSLLCCALPTPCLPAEGYYTHSVNSISADNSLALKILVLKWKYLLLMDRKL